MKAVVVYESFWGNTAKVAKAIAEGIGADATVLTTSEATAAALADADLIVAGAPVLGFSLPTDSMRANIAGGGKGPAPDVSHRSMRSWLDELQRGAGHFAVFETRLWWSPGGATNTIERGLGAAGYRKVAPRERFIVTGTYGPLKGGELERAHAWGASLRDAVS